MIFGKLDSSQSELPPPTWEMPSLEELSPTREMPSLEDLEVDVRSHDSNSKISGGGLQTDSHCGLCCGGRAEAWSDLNLDAIRDFEGDEMWYEPAPTFGDGSSVISEQAPTFDDGSSVISEQAPTFDDGSSVCSDQASTFDDNSSVSSDATPLEGRQIAGGALFGERSENEWLSGSRQH